MTSSRKSSQSLLHFAFVEASSTHATLALRTRLLAPSGFKLLGFKFFKLGFMFGVWNLEDVSFS